MKVPTPNRVVTQRGRVRRRGAGGFEQHYAALFGKRWVALSRALRAPVRQVARLNAFADERSVSRLRQALPACSELADCRWLPLSAGETEVSTVEPSRDRRGLLTYYPMDAASLFPAYLLAVEPGMRVLDLCAAPGGKALMLAERLGASGQLILNDRSRARRARLRRVLVDYLPAEVRAVIRVTGHDAARVGLHEPAAYDRILLDAPCSSERHVLGSASHLTEWSERRIERLSRQQYAMLVSAFRALGPGGKLVYATCALAPDENDAVVQRLLSRAERASLGAGRPLLERPRLKSGEPTEFGHQWWPDAGGFGPLYASVLRKESGVHAG